jgi:outer membrane biogenesis lipoprotein LolB
MRRALAALLLASLAGCATPALRPGPMTPADAARTDAVVEGLRARGAEITSLRASARVSVAGATGESFSRQLVLLQRPARMRVEVMGLLGQRTAVLATDGESYQLYRAGEPGLESGPVHARILWEVAQVPLVPRDAVDVLLAAPPLPPSGARGAFDAAGAGRVEWPDRSVEVDAGGHLVAFAWSVDGEPHLEARYDEWTESAAGAFPQRVTLRFPGTGGHAVVSLRDVELNPSLAPELFRLAPRVSSRPRGEAR